jgi:hypothetical protein
MATMLVDGNYRLPFPPKALLSALSNRLRSAVRSAPRNSSSLARVFALTGFCRFRERALGTPEL